MSLGAFDARVMSHLLTLSPEEAASELSRNSISVQRRFLDIFRVSDPQRGRLIEEALGDLANEWMNPQMFVVDVPDSLDVNIRDVMANHNVRIRELIANIDSPQTRNISFERAQELLQNEEVRDFVVVPELQEDLRSGNTLVTLITYSGREYDVEARYDSVTKQIFPPN